MYRIASRSFLNRIDRDPQQTLILSYTINNVKTEFGVVPSQRTLGQLIYSKSNVISIEYIRNSDKTKITENVTMDKTYETVPANYDLMLVGGAP